MNLKTKLHVANELAVLEAELAKRDSYKFARFFPDKGPLRRELYRAAMEFFKFGATYPERLILGGNRTGKTEGAAFECTLHATGRYPDWWEGRRFDTPVEIWHAGDTATTTRDIGQRSLFGINPESARTGMIPAHLIKHVTPKSAVPGAVESIYVNHVSGKTSVIQFKSYDQRREAFQGTSKHIIWLDEECPDDVYTECLLRTLTVGGIMMVTFTPIEGLTPFVQNWLENAVMFDGFGNLVPAEAQVFAGSDDADDTPNADSGESKDAPAVPIEKRTKTISMVSWDEVPHLSETARNQMLASIPPYQRAARTRGIPSLGAGVIYPIPE